MPGIPTPLPVSAPVPRIRGLVVLLALLGFSGVLLSAAGPPPPASGAQATRPPRASTEPMRELRGVWVDRSSLVSREEIRSTMRTLAAARFNVAFVNVWSRGYPLWRSRVFARETGIATDPEYGDRDVLREAIEEARAAGIHVMAWAEYGFIGGYTGHHPGKNGCGPIFDRHPDWMARTQGGDTRFVAPGGFFCWMVQARPDVQRFLLSLMEELARNYRTAGIQFDRARYPTLECGYDDVTRRLYFEQRGLPLPSDPKDAAWVRWRADNLNTFIRTLYRRLEAVRPAGLVSNAPIVYPYGYENFAQDYPGWMKDEAVDFMVPQVYRKDVAAYERDLDEQIAAVGGGERLVPGIDVTNSNVEVLIDAIQVTRRKGLPGVVIWYHRGLERAGAFDRLAATVFARPAVLPW